MKRLASLAAALCLSASPALAAWATPTQVTTAVNAGASSLTSSSVSVSAGHLIVVSGTIRGTTITGITDQAGDTFTLATPCQRGANTDYSFVAWTVTAGLSSQTISTTQGGTSTGTAFVVWDITGQAASSPEDTAARACAFSNTAVTNPSVTSGTPSQSGDLFIASWGSPTSSSGLTYATAGSWLPATNFFAGNTSIGTVGTYLDATGSGTTQTNSPTTASRNYMFFVTAFKPLAAASTAHSLSATGAGQ